MSAEIKRVKLLTLLQLGLGIALIALGVVLHMQAFGGGAWALVGEGAVSLVFSVRGALIANVPARIGKLATLALAVCLVQVALVALVVYMQGPDDVAANPVAVATGAVVALLSLVVATLSRGIAKRAER